MKVTFADGSVYEGELRDGRVCGEGKYVSAMGEVIEGAFKNGQLNGKGRWVGVPLMCAVSTRKGILWWCTREEE
jgi:hypothetical protein